MSMTALATSNRDRATYTRDMDLSERRTAQRQLQTLGHDATRQSVMEFQRAKGIQVDGIIGPETSGALNNAMAERERSGVDRNLRVVGERRAPSVTDRAPDGTTPARDLITRDEQRRTTRTNGAELAPRSASERQKFEHYASIVRANGGQVNPNGQATVLGIRAQDGVTKKFEDKLVVLQPNGRVLELDGSTRPGNTTSRGVAQIRTGNYQVVPNGPHYGKPSWHVRTLGGSGNIPAMRDTNRDGRYSAAEKATRSTATEILFHVPNPKYNDAIPTSIGCVNVKNADLQRFMSAIGGRGASFNFSLVDR